MSYNENKTTDSYFNELNYGGICQICNKETDKLWVSTITTDGKQNSYLLCRECASRYMNSMREKDSSISREANEILPEHPKKHSLLGKKEIIIICLTLALCAAIIVGAIGLRNYLSIDEKSNGDNIAETDDYAYESDTDSAINDFNDSNIGISADGETNPVKNEEMNEKTVRKFFVNFLKLYYEWMDVIGIEEGYDGSTPIQLKDEQTAYRIGRKGFNCVADVDRAFLEYCSPSVYETMIPFWELIDMNDALYYVVFVCGPSSSEYYVGNVERLSDSKFKVTTIENASQPGDLYPEIYVNEWLLEEQSSGKWLITYRDVKELRDSNLPKGDYYTVSTKGSPLNVRFSPDENSQVVQSVPNRTDVEVRIICDGWGLIHVTNNEGYTQEGWVKMDYLKK